MLVELAVENYAVIERVRVRFHPGLNLLTGETGSGKSIVVDALGLLFGGRSSAEMVRGGADRGPGGIAGAQPGGADRARVSGVFEISSSPELLVLLQRAGVELEDGELLVEREIQSNGKSRALVGNRPATAALLRDLAPFLGDIHGQHDQQQLFSPTVQRGMLDAFAGAEALIRDVAAPYRAWRNAVNELEKLDRTSQEKLRLADLWAFQRKEIETVAPRPGEDAELEGERRVLRNVVRLQESAGAAYAALYEDALSAVAQLGAAAKRLDEVARIDESIREVIAALQPASIGLEEAAHALRHYLGALEADPRRLDEVESRLNEIEKLKRKYGATIEETLAFLDRVKADLAAVESSSERRQTLEREIALASAAYESAASRLSIKRSEAAGRLARRVEHELAALAMEKTRIEIRVETEHGTNAWSEHGSDTVRVLISPNPGEEPKPLEKLGDRKRHCTSGSDLGGSAVWRGRGGDCHRGRGRAYCLPRGYLCRSSGRSYPLAARSLSRPAIVGRDIHGSRGLVVSNDGSGKRPGLVAHPIIGRLLRFRLPYHRRGDVSVDQTNHGRG